MVYCASDNTVSSVGVENSVTGKMSPSRMNSTTFCDENRLFTQNRSKSIGVSLKDRGAILPAGHTANAAYWFLGKNKEISLLVLIILMNFLIGLKVLMKVVLLTHISKIGIHFIQLKLILKVVTI